MKLLYRFLALGLLVVAGLGAFQVVRTLAPPRFHATAYEPPEPAPDFSLTDHAGRTLRMRDLRGRPLLLFFGYASCPDVCPLTLATLRRALDAVEDGESRARIVLITVDPARDTPAALAAYVARFGPGVIGLTGSEETLRKLYTAFGVGAQTAHGKHHAPTIMHTSGVYGIDDDGRIRVLLRQEHPRKQLEEDIRTLLRL